MQEPSLVEGAPGRVTLNNLHGREGTQQITLRSVIWAGTVQRSTTCACRDVDKALRDIRASITPRALRT